MPAIDDMTDTVATLVAEPLPAAALVPSYYDPSAPSVVSRCGVHRATQQPFFPFAARIRTIVH